MPPLSARPAGCSRLHCRPPTCAARSCSSSSGRSDASTASARCRRCAPGRSATATKGWWSSRACAGVRVRAQPRQRRAGRPAAGPRPPDRHLQRLRGLEGLVQRVLADPYLVDAQGGAWRHIGEAPMPRPSRRSGSCSQKRGGLCRRGVDASGSRPADVRATVRTSAVGRGFIARLDATPERPHAGRRSISASSIAMRSIARPQRSLHVGRLEALRNAPRIIVPMQRR